MMKSLTQSGLDGYLSGSNLSDITIDESQGFLYYKSEKKSSEGHQKVNVAKLTHTEESGKQSNHVLNEIINKFKSDRKWRLFCGAIYILIIMKISIMASVVLLCGSH